MARIVGVPLLVLVGLFWLTLIPAMFDDPSETPSLILGGVILSVVPFGLGLYALRRSRNARRDTPSHP